VIAFGVDGNHPLARPNQEIWIEVLGVTAIEQWDFKTASGWGPAPHFLTVIERNREIAFETIEIAVARVNGILKSSQLIRVNWHRTNFM